MTSFMAATEMTRYSAAMAMIISPIYPAPTSLTAALATI